MSYVGKKVKKREIPCMDLIHIPNIFKHAIGRVEFESLIGNLVAFFSLSNRQKSEHVYCIWFQSLVITVVIMILIIIIFVIVESSEK